MILAAGRGKRMGALTESTPKPLLKVAGKYLIEYAIESLKRGGIGDIVINVCHHGEQIMKTIGDGKRYGVNITYSQEIELLETGGGILKALPWLGDEPFVVTSCDIITDYPFQQLPRLTDALGHVVMVTNPVYHPNGDFGLQQGRLNLTTKPFFTFANISVFSPAFFAGSDQGYFRLTKLLMPAVENSQLTGEHYQGLWYNVGTPEDLAEANQHLSA